MEKTLEELILDGKKFMEAFQQLDEYGKLSVVSYMRGYREGQMSKEKTA